MAGAIFSGFRESVLDFLFCNSMAIDMWLSSFRVEVKPDQHADMLPRQRAGRSHSVVLTMRRLAAPWLPQKSVLHCGFHEHGTVDFHEDSPHGSLLRVTDGIVA